MSRGGKALLLLLAVTGVALLFRIYLERRDSQVRHASPIQLPAAARPALWLLSIGVSHYEDSDLELRYAAADARAVAEAFVAQEDGPLYREVRARLLLDEDVTRDRVMREMTGFLGQAGPDDVVVIFMAGHGVRDRATGSYYFLPHATGPENLRVTGLRMSDFDEMLLVLRQNVARIVVMMDTCYAGALPLRSRALVGGDDLAAQVSLSEGLFILAAAKPGEESKERPDLEHGAFTYALLDGLAGAADLDADGIVNASDLFAHVSRRVPRLTGGLQHPYHRMEGTDLPLAAVLPGLELVEDAGHPPETMRPKTIAAARAQDAIGLIRFDNLRGNEEHDWIGMALLAALNTELTRRTELTVHAPELIRPSEYFRASDLIDARVEVELVITGTYTVVGGWLRIDALIVERGTAVQRASASVEGPLDQFFALQRELTEKLLLHLPAPIPTEVLGVVPEPERPLNAYRLLLEAEGLAGSAESETPNTPTIERTGEPLSWLSEFVAAPALGQGIDLADERDVMALVDRYARAHEEEDVDAVAALYSVFSDTQRKAVSAYFENAGDLEVEISDVRLERRDGALIVSFTRHDAFVDLESGREAALDVRLDKRLVRIGTDWKFAAPE